MKTNHQMNYYDYGKNLDIQGVMPVIVGVGVNTDTHEYVDLGLPSGSLWATENIKDSNGNELYFAWGGISGYTAEQVGNEEGKRTFDITDCEFFSGGGYTKYNGTDGLTVLEPEDDAATVNWGEGWRMPTNEEFAELTANTTTAWTQVDGVNGMLFTSTANTNTLFFPAVGYAADGKVGKVGDEGNYWSAYVSTAYGGSYPPFLDLSTEKCYLVNDGRYFGRTVRPVRSNN